MLIGPLQADGYADPQERSQTTAANMASTYVPLESWVYPVFESLAAKGYIQSAFFNLRPWTRLDCARLIEEAEDLTADQSVGWDVVAELQSLRQEFAPELALRAGAHNTGFVVDSIYQRVTTIAGRPLTDGYHFAETLVNNEGRPFGQGANLYSGISVRAAAGPFAAYVQGEMQRAAPAVAPSAEANEQIAIADFTTAGAAGPASGFLRGRLLDANASFAFANNQITFGRQSLWWGPARSGATLFSDNAEPITMLRYDRIRPIELPWIFRLLGPIRAQLFLGRLSGAQFVQADHSIIGSPGRALDNQPWIHGQKFTFEPTPNFQFGIARTVLFAGKGAPFTTRSFLRSVFSTGEGNEENDPGDRRISFDALYRIPGVRTCLTGYVDTFTEDEPFPVFYPRRSVWISGFALRCFPRTTHLTVRAEGLLSPHRNEFPGYYYFNVHYLSGYTNQRQLIGSWIGREGQGEQLWATWQLSPRSSIEVNGRSMNVSGEFLRGGSLRDLTAAADLALGSQWRLRLEGQAEWWQFPLLAASKQRNAALTFQISYRPQGKIQ
jgi:hypothetical protein